MRIRFSYKTPIERGEKQTVYQLRQTPRLAKLFLHNADQKAKEKARLEKRFYE